MVATETSSLDTWYYSIFSRNCSRFDFYFRLFVSQSDAFYDCIELLVAGLILERNDALRISFVRFEFNSEKWKFFVKSVA